jgi:acyl-CoA synthetase (AMP-forming)/AMP-acid ligase II
MLNLELIRQVPDLLATRSHEQPEKMAFRDDRKAVTYKELFFRTGNLASQLATQGFSPGDRAAIYMANRVEAVESYLAIPRAGGVAVCIDPQATERDVRYMFEDSGASVAITDLEHFDRLARMRGDVPGLGSIVLVGKSESPTREGVFDYESFAGRRGSADSHDALPLDAAAWMLYTSGTTGRPKGVVLSQRGMLWVVAASYPLTAGYGSDDYALSPLPLFHSYALNVSVLAVVAVGATEYVMDRFSTKRTLDLLRTEAITFLPGVPTMFHYLLHEAREEGLQANALRVCLSAGAIMPATLNRDFEQAFRVPLLDGYGITETSTFVTMNSLSGSRIMGSCGLPLVGSAMRIVEPTNGEDLPPNQEGEVWVRGPHVMLGYHNKPEETERALEGGWYRTGDLARRDENGFLTITGRIKELIIRGGENIAPIELEEIMLAHPDIADCAVVGTPHEALGEVPVAFVVPKDPRAFETESLLEYCSQNLPAFKVPAKVVETDSIPRTGSGKTKRFLLQEKLVG